MNKTIDFLLNSNLFLSFCVACLTLATQIKLDSFSVEILWLLFFGAFISYNFQRIIAHEKLKVGLYNSWYKKNRKNIYFLLGIFSIMFIYFFLKLTLNSKLIVFFLSLISFLYPFGLRAIPFLKIFLISFSWALSTTALIYFENNLFIDKDFYLDLLSRFCFVLSITIPFDIRDVKYDNKSLQTIPMIFGISNSKKIALAFLFSYLLIECYFSLFVKMNLNFLLASFFCYLYSFYFVSKANDNRGNFYYSFWLESCSVLLLLFLIIASIFCKISSYIYCCLN